MPGMGASLEFGDAPVGHPVGPLLLHLLRPERTDVAGIAGQCSDQHPAGRLDVVAHDDHHVTLVETDHQAGGGVDVACLQHLPPLQRCGGVQRLGDGSASCDDEPIHRREHGHETIAIRASLDGGAALGAPKAGCDVGVNSLDLVGGDEIEPPEPVLVDTAHEAHGHAPHQERPQSFGQERGRHHDELNRATAGQACRLGIDLCDLEVDDAGRLGLTRCEVGQMPCERPTEQGTETPSPRGEGERITRIERSQ